MSGVSLPGESWTPRQYRKEIYKRIWEEYGPTPEGVGWKNYTHQTARFLTIVEEIREELQGESGPVSLLDVGAGYGHLRDHLRSLITPIEYTGLEDNKSIHLWYSQQSKQFRDQYHLQDVDWLDDDSPSEFWERDIVVASGLFSYYTVDDMLKGLRRMWEATKRMMVFNVNDTAPIRNPVLLMETLGIEWYRVRKDYMPGDTTVTAFRVGE